MEIVYLEHVLVIIFIIVVLTVQYANMHSALIPIVLNVVLDSGDLLVKVYAITVMEMVFVLVELKELENVNAYHISIPL